MRTNTYMADVLAAFHEAGRELSCLEQLITIASEAEQPQLVGLLSRLAEKCEDKIGELHNELRTAGWSDE